MGPPCRFASPHPLRGLPPQLFPTGKKTWGSAPARIFLRKITNDCGVSALARRDFAGLHALRGAKQYNKTPLRLRRGGAKHKEK